jgi:CRISPR type I-E-associated protein CasB/Cse2
MPNFNIPNVRDTLYDWRKKLEHNSANRAILRRAQDLRAVFLEASLFDLLNTLNSAVKESNAASPQEKIHFTDSRLAMIAGLAAQCKESSLSNVHTLGKCLADGKISNLRFKKLLRTDDDEAQFRMWRRVLNQLDNNVNLAALANAIWWWGDNTKRALAYEYYSALQGSTANDEIEDVTAEIEEEK